MGWRAVHFRVVQTALYSLVVTDTSVTGANLGSLSGSGLTNSDMSIALRRWSLAHRGPTRATSYGGLTRTIRATKPASTASSVSFPPGADKLTYGIGLRRWSLAHRRTLTGDELWRINPDNPGDETSGVYGLVGVFPIRADDSPTSLGVWRRPLARRGQLVVTSYGASTRTTLSDTSGVYGLVGTFPSELTSPSGHLDTAMAAGSWSILQVTSSGASTRHNPGDTSGVYGLVGTLPAGS